MVEVRRAELSGVVSPGLQGLESSGEILNEGREFGFPSMVHREPQIIFQLGHAMAGWAKKYPEHLAQLSKSSSAIQGQFPTSSPSLFPW